MTSPNQDFAVVQAQAKSLSQLQGGMQPHQSGLVNNMSTTIVGVRYAKFPCLMIVALLNYLDFDN